MYIDNIATFEDVIIMLQHYSITIINTNYFLEPQ
jgi:hypothetical protein